MLWWIDSCACVAVKLLGALVRALPLRAALWLGRRVGDIARAGTPAGELQFKVIRIE